MLIGHDPHGMVALPTRQLKLTGLVLGGLPESSRKAPKRGSRWVILQVLDDPVGPERVGLHGVDEGGFVLRPYTASELAAGGAVTCNVAR